MLLNFVREVLEESHYSVITAATGEEGYKATSEEKPDLVILDDVLPDVNGGEISRRLAEDPETNRIPVLCTSGFAGEDRSAGQSPNVVGFLHKPFTADSLLEAVEQHLPRVSGANALQAESPSESETAITSEFASVISPEPQPPEAVAASSPIWGETPVASPHTEFASYSSVEPDEASNSSRPDLTGQVFFAGDTNFFSLNWALRTIGRESLSGVLRCFWNRADVELFTREGKVLLATTRDPELYCSEAPITLVNIDAGRVNEARTEQSRTGCPLFLTLAREDLIIRDAAAQLIQHYGQKLFGLLWGAPRVRFVFEQASEVPEFVRELVVEEDVDQWTLAAVRSVQFQDIAEKAVYDPNWIPAYTRDGFERVQTLRLTVAEAQFASQFNGSRSLAQIARNLRLDMKLARLNLFRFVALEVVECWPPSETEDTDRGGVLKRLGRKMGLGE